MKRASVQRFGRALVIVVSVVSRAASQPTPQCDRDPLGDCIAPARKLPQVTLNVVPIAPQPEQVRVWDAKDPKRILCQKTPCRPVVTATTLPIEVLIESKLSDEYATEKVEADSAQRVAAALAPCPKLDIESRPEGATLSVNGVFLGPIADVTHEGLMRSLPGPAAPGCDLPFGSYRFEVRAEGYKDWILELEFERKPGAAPSELRKALQVKLEPVRGSLVISSPVHGAEVLIDGVVKGKLLPSAGERSLLTVSGVPPGDREVVLRFTEQRSVDEATLWGTFQRRRRVHLDAGNAKLVQFALPKREPSPLPGRYRVDREELDRLCPASSAACLALGWALHAGAGGPRDDVAAAQKLAVVCQNGAARSISSWLFQRSTAEYQMAACLSYRWLVDMGFAAAEPAADEAARATLSAACRPTPAARAANGATTLRSKPLTSCLQTRLNGGALRSVDPTSAIPGLDPVAPIAATLSNVAYLTQHHIYNVLEFGLHVPLLYSMDSGLLFGTAKRQRGGLSLVAGIQQSFAFYLFPQTYLPVGGAWIWNLGGDDGDLLGVHTGVRWVARRATEGLYVEVGGGVAHVRMKPEEVPPPSFEEDLGRQLLGLPPLISRDGSLPAAPETRGAVVLEARLAVGWNFGY